VSCGRGEEFREHHLLAGPRGRQRKKLNANSRPHPAWSGDAAGHRSPWPGAGTRFSAGCRRTWEAPAAEASGANSQPLHHSLPAQTTTPPPSHPTPTTTPPRSPPTPPAPPTTPHPPPPTEPPATPHPTQNHNNHRAAGSSWPQANLAKRRLGGVAAALPSLTPGAAVRQTGGLGPQRTVDRGGAGWRRSGRSQEGRDRAREATPNPNQEALTQPTPTGSGWRGSAPAPAQARRCRSNSAEVRPLRVTRAGCCRVACGYISYKHPPPFLLCPDAETSSRPAGRARIGRFALHRQRLTYGSAVIEMKKTPADAARSPVGGLDSELVQITGAERTGAAGLHFSSDR